MHPEYIQMHISASAYACTYMHNKKSTISQSRSRPRSHFPSKSTQGQTQILKISCARACRDWDTASANTHCLFACLSGLTSSSLSQIQGHAAATVGLIGITHSTVVAPVPYTRLISPTSSTRGTRHDAHILPSLHSPHAHGMLVPCPCPCPYGTI